MAEHRGDPAYSSTGFGRRMGWGTRPALVLVDVCKAYWTPGSPLDLTAHQPSAASPEVMKRLVAAARRAEVPVVWTTVEYTDGGMRDAGLFWLKSKNLSVWQTGDDRGLGDFLDGLTPEAGDLVIKKKYPSAFFGTTLATDLKVLGADTLVICGVSTSGCVRATALDSMCNGYRPMVSWQRAAAAAARPRRARTRTCIWTNR